MLRRPPTLITLTTDDLLTVETNHQARVASSLAKARELVEADKRARQARVDEERQARVDEELELQGQSKWTSGRRSVVRMGRAGTAGLGRGDESPSKGEVIQEEQYFDGNMDGTTDMIEEEEEDMYEDVEIIEDIEEDDGDEGPEEESIMPRQPPQPPRHTRDTTRSLRAAVSRASNNVFATPASNSTFTPTIPAPPRVAAAPTRPTARVVAATDNRDTSRRGVPPPPPAFGGAVRAGPSSRERAGEERGLEMAPPAAPGRRRQLTMDERIVGSNRDVVYGRSREDGSVPATRGPGRR